MSLNKQLFKLLFSAVLLLVFVNISQGQIEEKPDLDFEIEVNKEEEKLEVTWSSCLENSVITLLDSKLRSIRIQSLCKDNGNIDIKGLKDDLYYVKVEHYTGIGVRPVVKDFNSSNTEFKTAIHKIEEAIDFDVFPNPANNLLNIELSSSRGRSEVTLIGIGGQVLMYQEFENERTVLDLSNLEKGIYWVQIKNDQGFGVQQFVKM